MNCPNAISDSCAPECTEEFIVFILLKYLNQFQLGASKCTISLEDVRLVYVVLSYAWISFVFAIIILDAFFQYLNLSFFVPVKIGTLYFISGFGGSLMSSLFIQSSISVGASGALFGLLGSMLSELITNWTIYANKVFLGLLIMAANFYTNWGACIELCLVSGARVLVIGTLPITGCPILVPLRTNDWYTQETVQVFSLYGWNS